LSQNKAESFANYYIEAQGPDYDREQLLFTLRDLAGAGMETSATFIRWAIVLLTNHGSVQARLHDEIDAIIGTQRLPTLDDRSRLLTHLHTRFIRKLQKYRNRESNQSIGFISCNAAHSQFPIELRNAQKTQDRQVLTEEKRKNK